MLYTCCRAVCLVFLMIFRRLRVVGDTTLPAGQGFLVISNHTSYWDPVVVGCVLKRRISYMGKAELFEIPLLGFIIKKFGAFPVHRGGIHPSSIRYALNLFKTGKVVGIFPEGTRSKTDELLDPHLGAVMLALKGDVPVVPIALSGTKGFWSQIKVNIGKPISVAKEQEQGRKVSREDMVSISRELMSEINRLLRLMSEGHESSSCR